MDRKKLSSLWVCPVIGILSNSLKEITGDDPGPAFRFQMFLEGVNHVCLRLGLCQPHQGWYRNRKRI